VLTINPKNLEEVPIYVPEKLEEQRKMAQQLK